MLQAITDDILQLRLPLPFRLNHVNVYLLRDGDRWALIDTGLNWKPARELWRAILQQHDITLSRILLTHVHPDHYGLAGWLQQQAAGQLPLALSAAEAAFADVVWGDLPRQVARMQRFFIQCGLPPALAEQVACETGRTGERTLPHPTKVDILTAGRTITIGAREFELIEAPGHSVGQMLFYDRADRLLLSGDHVLLKITPHIGYWPELDANPLAAYLASLDQLKDLDVRLALPGHRDTISSWRTRIDELQQHHAERLDAICATVSDSLTVAEIAQRHFRLDALDAHESRFAIAETLSHLDLLAGQGRLQLQHGDVWRYRR